MLCKVLALPLSFRYNANTQTAKQGHKMQQQLTVQDFEIDLQKLAIRYKSKNVQRKAAGRLVISFYAHIAPQCKQIIAAKY
jgi:hypothetical protein